MAVSRLSGLYLIIDSRFYFLCVCVASMFLDYICSYVIINTAVLWGQHMQTAAETL